MVVSRTALLCQHRRSSSLRPSVHCAQQQTASLAEQGGASDWSDLRRRVARARKVSLRPTGKQEEIGGGQETGKPTDFDINLVEFLLKLGKLSEVSLDVFGLEFRHCIVPSD